MIGKKATVILKEKLTKATALKPVDDERPEFVVLSVDSSLLGWGIILQQIVDSVRNVPCDTDLDYGL